jgi:hypothetical protein
MKEREVAKVKVKESPPTTLTVTRKNATEARGNGKRRQN